jgi:hypothetical protein
MDQRTAARHYGQAIGLAAGLFAALQVLISTTAARANWGNLDSAQRALADGTAVPQFLIGPLLPTLVATYLASILSGAIMVYLARRAGWLAAYVSGRREAGLVAGGWVALVSALIWIALSVVVVALTHADGSVTGLFTSNPTGPLRPLEIPGLLIQQLGAGLIGWGLGSLFGQMGGDRAPMPRAMPLPPTSPLGSGWPLAAGGPPRWPDQPPSSAGHWPSPADFPASHLPPRSDGSDPASIN